MYNGTIERVQYLLFRHDENPSEKKFIVNYNMYKLFFIRMNEYTTNTRVHIRKMT